jgi:hypothetical protein
MYHRIRVNRTEITGEETVEALRREMGDGYEVEQTASNIVIVRESNFRKARVDLQHKPDGTVFLVHGIGPRAFNRLFMMILNNGLAVRVVRAIERSAELRDDETAA